MKQLRAKLTAALLLFALVASLSPAALAVGGVVTKAGNINLTLNGTATKLGTYNIANNNYVKLRDVAQLLKGTGKEFSVTWNGSAQRIDLTTGQSYQSVGGELVPLAAGYQMAVPNSAAVRLNGGAVKLTAYTINGNNFFKLRDLGSALDFYVGWDAAAGTVVVDTGKGYVPETSASGGDQSAMARAMLDRLNADTSGDHWAANACLLDIDFDGVFELMTIGYGDDEWSTKQSLYDWKDGALQMVWSKDIIGDGFTWYLCKNTATGEPGIEEYLEHGGDYLGVYSIFYYPSGEFCIDDRTHADGSGGVVEEYFIDENNVTKAEWQAALGQHQRVQLLMGESQGSEHIAAVRSLLNGML